MILLRETVVFDDIVVRIELNDDLTYRLAYGDLVVYETGRRRVRGRGAAYVLRSVEQLRYDFERDVEALGGRLG
jgi:hypothetical protein